MVNGFLSGDSNPQSESSGLTTRPTVFAILWKHFRQQNGSIINK